MSFSYNNLDDHDDHQSIYTDEDYEHITEGKYGTPIFVPDNENEIDLELSVILEKERLIEKFVKDLKDNSVKLILNSTYKPTVSINVSIDIIKTKKDGRKFLLNKFKNELEGSRVERKHILLIQSTLNKNFDLICNNSTSIIEDKTKNDNNIEFESMVQKLLEENLDISFKEWSANLLKKRHLLNEKVNEYFPSMQLLLDFELAIKTILNIQDITLPFMGIVFAVPSSLKTAFFKFLRKLRYSYYTDKFTARAFVSHSANIAKEKLEKIDMLPQIKDKILLTPELSALFTGKDDDIREQFGIITRLLDGEGLETNSGVHGKRGYYGKYMFTWLGAAVDIPYSVYKFLSTIGFKIYFLRLPRIEVTEDDLSDQLTSKKNFSEKMEEIEKLLIDYLIWFEICPISIGQNSLAKIEWNKERDDKETIRIIARLALLLAHLRGHVVVYESSEHPDFLPVENSNNINNNFKSYIHNNKTGFSHRLPIIENPSRAAQQLYNLARGHALSYGRNYITKDDVSLVIKVVLSTSLIERVLVLDLLIANKGTLTTSQITESLRISNNSAKRTMTEFKGLELVNMDKIDDSLNSEYKITLNPKFNWFLTDEFISLRDGFKPTDNKAFLSKKKSTTTVRKNTPVQIKEKQHQKEKKEDQQEKYFESTANIDNNSNDLHKGKNTDSKKEEIDNFLMTNHLERVGKQQLGQK